MNVIGMLGVAATASVIVTLVRQFNREMAIYVSLTAAIVLTYYALEQFRPMLSYLYEMGMNGAVGSYTRVIMKLTAIGALTSVTADMCTDMGETAIAQKAELVGKGAAALAVFPVLKELVSSLGDLLM